MSLSQIRELLQQIEAGIKSGVTGASQEELLDLEKRLESIKESVGLEIGKLVAEEMGE